MTCDEALELLSAALDGELSPAERNTLDAHLAECDACAALFDELAGQSRLLRELDCDVPDELSSSILLHLPEQTPAKQRKAVPWRRWGTLAACLALVIWAGFSLSGRLGRNDAALEAAQTTADVAAAAETEETAVESTLPRAQTDIAAYSGEETVPESAVGFSMTASDEADSKTANHSLPIYGAQYLRVTWSEALSQPEAVLISTSEELSGLLARFSDSDLSDAVTAYDESWFDSAALVAVTLSEGSGSASHEVEDLLLTDEGCEVVISRQAPEVGTCDMAGWLILIETDTDIPQTGLTVVQEN